MGNQKTIEALGVRVGDITWDDTIFTLNPFSHYVICVSRLTASGHMRHPLQADLGEKEDKFCVCLCVRPPEHVPRNDSKQSGGGKCLRFSL